ncbi:MAG: Phenylalanine--tRNA ligase beta subunit [Candidatus Anoxychlamydiales bacterium]|nr:Phenylalanine--tRNA ligase beta subunit [Candidatus Anoxychlamydiales bacterium]
MKITLSLLKEFLNTNISVKDIATHLTDVGIEVDHILNEKPTFSNVVSAKIMDVKKHPKSKKLVIVNVFDGSEIYQVVCGANNCRKDLITAYAKVNSFITDENGNKINIKKAKLQDVESFGMLLSKKELNISDDHSKIIELPNDFKLGIDLASTIIDPILDISLTPNLGHCLSALGIARELGASINQKIKMPSFKLKEIDEKTSDKIKVDIQDDRCNRYACRILKNVKIAPSPFWLTQELEAMGQRSINNVVDVTNYVMLKLNQPMHAFDLDKINGSIIVNSNKNEIKFLSLDEIERTLPKNTLLISDEKKPLAIAGIIGGLNSHTEDQTVNILLESANFDSMTVRKSCKVLNVKTESSIRFEKKTDFNMVPFALDYAAYLIQNITNANILKGSIDIIKNKYKSKTIKCRLSRVHKILGAKISLSECLDIFKRLDFILKSSEDDNFELEIPSYRNDLNVEIDIIEEIARIFGYNNIPKIIPTYKSSSVYHSKKYLFEKDLKSYLRSSNLQEVITTDLIGPKFCDFALKFNLTKEMLVNVKHFKSIEQSILRPTLLPSFLEVLKFNQDRNNRNLHIYEISTVHFKKNDEVLEKWVLSILLSGKKAPYRWDKHNLDINFFDLKGILENILDSTLFANYDFKRSKIEALHPGRSSNILINDIEIGALGEVHPSILKAFDIKQKAYFLEIEIDSIFKNKKNQVKCTSPSEYPSTTRDLTITLENHIEVELVNKIIKSIDSTLLESFHLMDIFQLDQNKKNITFRFIYRDQFKTILFEEADMEHKKIVEKINSKI